jgi:hypothetical protein
MPRVPWCKQPSAYLQRLLRLRLGFRLYGLRYWRRFNYQPEPHQRLSFRQLMSQRILFGLVRDPEHQSAPLRTRPPRFNYSRVASLLSGPDPDYQAMQVYPMEVEGKRA